MIDHMLDRLGNLLSVGDICVCYSNMRTGSSTTRLVQYVGKVVRFTDTMVVVKCADCVGYSHYNGDEFRCLPENVFKFPAGGSK